MLELTGGHGAEVLVDFVGEGGATAEGVRMLRRAGDYHVVGYGEDISVPTIDIVSTEINIIGNLVGSYNDLCDLMALAARGAVTLHTAKYALDDFQSALDDLDAGTCPRPGHPRPLKGSPDMKSFIGIGISVGVLAGIWTQVSVELALITWVAFVAWATFFAAGGGREGFTKGLAANLSGVAWAWVASQVLEQATFNGRPRDRGDRAGVRPVRAGGPAAAVVHPRRVRRHGGVLRHGVRPGRDRAGAGVGAGLGWRRRSSRPGSSPRSTVLGRPRRRRPQREPPEPCPAQRRRTGPAAW